MPEFPIRITAQDRASVIIDRINARIAKMNEPTVRLEKSFAKLSDTTGLAKLATHFREVSRQALNAFESIGRIVAPLAAVTGVASAAGLLRIASNWATAGEKLGFTAGRLGIPLKQLHAMEGGAFLGGSSADAMVAGLRGLQQTAWDVRSGAPGSGAAQGLFAGLHLNPRESPATLFMDTIRALHGITYSETRARMGAILLGGAYEDLAPIMSMSAQQFSNLMERAEQLDPWTDALGKKSVELATAQRELGKAAEGLSNTLMIHLGPSITNLFKDLTQDLQNKSIGQGFADLDRHFSEMDDAVGLWHHSLEGIALFVAGPWLRAMLAPFATVAKTMAKLAPAGAAGDVAGALGAGMLAGGPFAISGIYRVLQNLIMKQRFGVGPDATEMFGARMGLGPDATEMFGAGMRLHPGAPRGPFDQMRSPGSSRPRVNGMNMIPAPANNNGAALASSATDRVLMARTLLGEAGGEGDKGMRMVADVIRNRAETYGKSIGAVIRARKQFSMWNRGDRGQYADDPRLAHALGIADQVLSGKVADETLGALNYANPDTSDAVNQRWIRNMNNQVRYRHHLFGTAGTVSPRLKAMGAPGQPGPNGQIDVTVRHANAPRGSSISATSRGEAVNGAPKIEHAMPDFAAA